MTHPNFPVSLLVVPLFSSNVAMAEVTNETMGCKAERAGNMKQFMVVGFNPIPQGLYIQYNEFRYERWDEFIPDIRSLGQVVVSSSLLFHPYLGKWSNLTDCFQTGWYNHELEKTHTPWQFTKTWAEVIPTE